MTWRDHADVLREIPALGLQMYILFPHLVAVVSVEMGFHDVIFVLEWETRWLQGV